MNLVKLCKKSKLLFIPTKQRKQDKIVFIHEMSSITLKKFIDQSVFFNYHAKLLHSMIKEELEERIGGVHNRLNKKRKNWFYK